MEMRERNVRSNAEDVVAGGEICAAEDIQLQDWAEVLLDRVHRAEVEVEKSQMAPNPEAEAAVEYKGYQALVDRTIDVFGDELTASRWLSMPTPDFNGATPIEIAESLHYDPTDVQRQFEPIFIRIEHGIDV